MAQDIFAPKTSFDIGYERPQQGVVDNTEKIKADFQAMSLGAQAKAVQGQAALERAEAGLIQSAIGIAGDAYTINVKGREKGAVDALFNEIKNIESQDSQKPMPFETKKSKYNNAIMKAASEIPGGYSTLAKHNTAIKAATGMDIASIAKSTEQEQYEQMQQNPVFQTAYLASKVTQPNLSEEDRFIYAQNEAAKTAAAELMQTTVKTEDLSRYYTDTKRTVEQRLTNLDTAIVASIQLKRDTGQPITTLDIESLEVRVAEAQRLVDVLIPNTVPEEERSQVDEYFTNLEGFLTQMKESKDPDRIATGVASYLAQTGQTMGEILAGAKIAKAEILSSQAGVEIFKVITTKLSDGSSTAALTVGGDLGSIFDALVEARQGEVIGPNTIMTQEELNIVFDTRNKTPKDMMDERAAGLELIKSLDVGELGTDQGKRQLVSGIASVVKSLNNLDIQQTGSKLSELVIDSGLVDKIKFLDNYDKATANQIRTLLNSAVTNNLRFSELKISSIETDGKGYTNRNPGLVWDEAEQVYYATDKEYIEQVALGFRDAADASLFSRNMVNGRLRLPKNTALAWGDIKKAYEHRDVVSTANRILAQTKVEEPDETMVDVGGVPVPERMEVLSFISSGEGGYNSSNRGTVNNEIIGSDNATKRGGKSLSEMTLGEIKRYQRISKADDPNRLFAVGAYQITPVAMDAAMKAAGVNDNTIFSPTVQDRMGLGLLLGTKRPKLAAYIKGESDDINAAMLQFAQEFASVPDPNTGRSFYANKGNKAKHTVAETREALERAREAYASGIISEVIPREGEISNTQIIDTASQAIESADRRDRSPRPVLRPTDDTQTEPMALNMISNADWLTPDLEKEMSNDGVDINNTPFFMSDQELENALDSGAIKVGQEVLLLIEGRPEFVRVTE